MPYIRGWPWIGELTIQCKCGHQNNAHEDRIHYIGPCDLCACAMFDVAIVWMPRIKRRKEPEELEQSEYPGMGQPNWSYNRARNSGGTPGLAQKELTNEMDS